MSKRRILFLLALAITVAAPAILALAYHFITLDPFMRPLGLTEEKFRNTAEGRAQIKIVIEIRSTPKTLSKRANFRLQDKILDAFDMFQITPVFRQVADAGNGPSVTYLVGSNRYGPYAPSNAANGVRASVDAYLMTLAAHPMPKDPS